MFRSATLRLTLWYTAIIMAVSLIFSSVLFNISRGQLEESLRRQEIRSRVQLRLDYGAPTTPPDVTAELAEGSAHLLSDLVLFNLVILFLSTLASYALARRTLDPIEEAHEAQARFTADASHELRTPLTAMKTEIEVALRDTKLSAADARGLLESNLEEIQKLEFLSNALLKLAQMDKSALPMQAVRITEVVDAAIGRIHKMATQRHIEVHKDLIDLTVQGDTSSLTEMIVVLLENAIKYSPDKSRIDVVVKKAANQARISVSDHGEGIKPADLPHVFDRFYRADNSRSKIKKDGYGLGLSIAQKMAELHDGSIEAKSTPEKGTTFIVKLPLRDKPKN